MGIALKFINVFLLAAVKYFLSFPYALLIGLNYEQALVVVLVGGIAGFFFFYHLSGLLIRTFHKHKHHICKIVPSFIKKRYQLFCEFRRDKVKLRFTRSNRFLVNLKAKYGLWGIIITSPVILSIPVGAFLLNKYYSRRKNVFAYMIISIVGWALFFSSMMVIFPNLA